jgi:glycosyltransferase involved in cell wall biosynthesis
MRRVLIFSLAYYPRTIGGAEVAVKEITDRIKPFDVEFDMVTLAAGDLVFERIGNVNVYRVGRVSSRSGASDQADQSGQSGRLSFVTKFLYIPRAFLKARQLHRQKKYDATWAIMASYAGAAAWLFKRINPKVSCLLSIQEGENFERRAGIFKFFFRRIFACADYLQVISKFLADWSKTMGARCPIEIIPNGVDYSHFTEPITPEKRKEIRHKFGFADRDTVLVTTSRLTHKNAVDDIISALSFLDKSCKLVILGSGENLAELQEQTIRLKLTERVVFGGFVDHAELPAHLKSSEIFIRPSRTEGLGNSFLEAMAAGIPVIATGVGGISDFLHDGETGLVCEANNPKSIALKVEKLVKDRESREYIVGRARDLIMRNYEWRGIAARMQNIFCARLKP